MNVEHRYCGPQALVESLLKKNVEPDSKDGKDQTPISWAAEAGHDAIVNLLLDQGFSKDSKRINDRTPLYWAVWNGHEAVVKLLLEEVHGNLKEERKRRLVFQTKSKTVRHNCC